MITTELLLENGFNKYQNSIKRKNYTPSYIESYQFKVKDEKGIKYFIDIDVWDHRDLVPQLSNLSFAAHCQFNGHSERGNNTFNTELFIDENTTLDYILNFFEKTFVRMECDYYDEY